MLIISVSCVTSTSIIQRRPPEEKDEESIDSDSDEDFQPRPKRTKQEHGLSAADSATAGSYDAELMHQKYAKHNALITACLEYAAQLGCEEARLLLEYKSVTSIPFFPEGALSAALWSYNPNREAPFITSLECTSTRNFYVAVPGTMDLTASEAQTSRHVAFDAFTFCLPVKSTLYDLYNADREPKNKRMVNLADVLSRIMTFVEPQLKQPMTDNLFQMIKHLELNMPMIINMGAWNSELYKALGVPLDQFENVVKVPHPQNWSSYTGIFNLGTTEAEFRTLDDIMSRWWSVTTGIQRKTTFFHQVYSRHGDGWEELLEEHRRGGIAGGETIRLAFEAAQTGIPTPEQVTIVEAIMAGTETNNERLRLLYQSLKDITATPEERTATIKSFGGNPTYHEIARKLFDMTPHRQLEDKEATRLINDIRRPAAEASYRKKNSGSLVGFHLSGVNGDTKRKIIDEHNLLVAQAFGNADNVDKPTSTT